MGRNVTVVGEEKKPVLHQLKKHAATIHCSNTLSLLQRKITNALLYHAYKELMLKEEHEISVKQLCKLIGYQGNNHAAIKDALKGLLSTVIEWNVVNDTTGVEDWTASSMLASVSLQGPLCYFAYSPRMKQLLHSPSMFGKIDLLVQSRFKSSYGLALYENCVRYRGLPYTKWFEVEIFRKLMGVPPGKYNVFRDFKRRVLDKSIEEVNTYSELIVEAEILREGRQVTKIRFSLKERAKKIRLGKPLDIADIEQSESETIQSKLISQFGLSMEQVKQVLREYGSDFIVEKIAVIESSKNYQRGNVHNLAGYFLSALKHNYQTGKGSGEVLQQKRKHEAVREEELRKLEMSLKRIKQKYLVYKEEIIDAAIENLNPAEKAEFLGKFTLHAASAIETILKLQRRKYNRETVLHSPQLKAQLRQYALQHLSVVADKIPDFEKFAKNLGKNHQKTLARLQELEPEHQLLDISETA